jgi:hypothetical protein
LGWKIREKSCRLYRVLMKKTKDNTKIRINLMITLEDILSA